jgi:hypothetical protein
MPSFNESSTLAVLPTYFWLAYLYCMYVRLLRRLEVGIDSKEGLKRRHGEQDQGSKHRHGHPRVAEIVADLALKDG